MIRNYVLINIQQPHMQNMNSKMLKYIMAFQYATNNKLLTLMYDMIYNLHMLCHDYQRGDGAVHVCI